MPRRDGTGPLGEGPLMGWGGGKCPGARRQRNGRGPGRDTGRGRGSTGKSGLLRRIIDLGADLMAEKREKEGLKSEVDAVRKRVDELERGR